MKKIEMKKPSAKKAKSDEEKQHAQRLIIADLREAIGKGVEKALIKHTYKVTQTELNTAFIQFLNSGAENALKAEREQGKE